MIFADITPNTTKADKQWFQFDPLRPKTDMVGFDKADGRNITLMPGDFIELTNIEIASNQRREIMHDGTMIKVTAEQLKKVMKDYEAIGTETAISTNDEEWLALDDTEFLNRATAIKSRSRLKAMLEIAKKKENVSYCLIQGLEKLITNAKSR